MRSVWLAERGRGLSGLLSRLPEAAVFWEGLASLGFEQLGNELGMLLQSFEEDFSAGSGADAVLTDRVLRGNRTEKSDQLGIVCIKFNIRHARYFPRV